MGRSTTGRAALGAEQRERYHWTEQQAREVVAELRATGETAAQFAQRKGITRQRLAYWVTRLEPARPAPAGPAFVQVTPVPAMARAAATAAPSASPAEPIEIRVGLAVIRIGPSHDVEQVARLVDAVARRTAVSPC